METQKVNSLKFKTTFSKKGIDYIVTIKLADECRNGHNDFSITADTYLTGKPYTDRNNQGGGAMGDTIAKLKPEFKIFNDLHLSDVTGVPMHGIANGYYWMNEGNNKDYAISTLRITEDEYTTLKNCKDKLIFQFTLESLGIVKRWKEEANTAIAKLEELTGCKFIDNSTRLPYTPLTFDQLTEIGQRINSGYYNPEAIKQRETDALQAKRDKLMAEIEAKRDKAILRAENDYKIEKYVLLSGLPLDNYIYYGHTNTVVFNWKDYDKKITKEEFDNFVQNLNYTELPDNVIFEFEKQK